MKGSEFRDVFGKCWLRHLPKPESLRFDDEGAFRDAGSLDWLEAMAIKVSVIAGEAAWQVGKHSRHLEVLKENMSLLALELGPETKAEELLSLSVSAKNELHNVRGYSPNQWCFGQNSDRVQSFLQHGNHLPTNSMREQESFESTLKRAEAARKLFLQADSRQRIHRAARGRARKSETFEIGQLVFFYRKGRNNTTRHEPGWHGPARVVAVEKQGDPSRNQATGSVVWVVHATVLYRCAPEQLRSAPASLREAYELCHGQSSPLEEVQSAGNQMNYRDISRDLESEPEDSEIHDCEPRNLGSSEAVSRTPHHRLFGKQPRHEQQQHIEQQHEASRRPPAEERQDCEDRQGAQPESGTRPMPVDSSRTAGRQEGERRESQGPDRQNGERGPQVREMAPPAPGGERELRQRPDLQRAGPPSDDRSEFWQKATERRPARQRTR